ncbi:rhodanese-like domain-containing protein [Natranaeroarchaeum aerophilus]|uniref:Ferredoxin--nitrite reductase n=1 Tax=Natranaeroarchaeum aerophilus TaxID=2917711 RepID=A0AAE3FS16_9EURY|nr:rhodanese-like domain-containing protein [Natranaeroarchaeum aerophilus]MCL9814268.1 ferredoxin--nitrite reductase [Natranaeroarchaeum aerophilus]
MTLDSPVFVDPSWVEKHSDVTLVDVRERREYRDVGHVPAAVNVPFDSVRDPSSVATGMLPGREAFETLLGDVGISNGETLVAYDGGDGVYAARFLLTAAVYGHGGNLYLVDGGFDALRDRLGVTADPVDPEPAEYDADEPDAQLLADRDDVEAAVDAETTQVVDTRTAAEYDHSHVPTATQLSWERFVDDDGRLRPTDEIESILDEQGLSPETAIVLYCNTARRLSHTFAVLTELGYEDVSFYEGSLTDWVRAESPDWDPERLYERVRAVAADGFEALPHELGEDIFGRLHLIGLYTQKQDGYFMLRTKVPNGVLTAEQARTYGEIVDEFARAPGEYGGTEQNPEFGDGFLDVTTRQGLQAHWVRVEDMPEIWDRYEEVGLTTIQASGNTLRNVVACPASGLGEEVTDVRSLGEDIADAFEGNQRYANLPRKLKVSLSGCHENCGRSEIQDLGFTPAIKDGRDGFHVKLGGGLSDGPRAATDLDIFVEPEQVEPLTLAVADLFIEHGSYIDTAVNRLKFIVEEYGIDGFREELERYVDFDFEDAGKDLTTSYRGDHVGVHETEDGYYVGLNLPTGRMRGEELVELADLAERYGSGELRLTANQNVVIAGVRENALDDLLAEPLLERYSPDPGPFTRGIVTCTGAEFCKYGVVETKSRGIEWARMLDSWLAETDRVDESDLPDAVRVHMSGCSASCAQPQIGDVAMRGEAKRTPEGTKDAADVGLGGDLGRGTFADWIAGSVVLDDVPDGITRLVSAYAADGGTEAFSGWTERVPDADLRQLIRGEARADAVVQDGDRAASEVN